MDIFDRLNAEVREAKNNENPHKYYNGPSGTSSASLSRHNNEVFYSHNGQHSPHYSNGG